VSSTLPQLRYCSLAAHPITKDGLKVHHTPGGPIPRFRIHTLGRRGQAFEARLSWFSVKWRVAVTRWLEFRPFGAGIFKVWGNLSNPMKEGRTAIDTVPRSSSSMSFHRAIPRHGCFPAEPASVSPGRISLAPPRKSRQSDLAARGGPAGGGVAAAVELLPACDRGRQRSAIRVLPACPEA